MSQVVTFKCPACGAYLEYDPSLRSLTCPYCGYQVKPDELPDAGAAETSAETAPETDPQTGLRAYHCKTCGAQAVTGETTAATSCYYCHSPIVLTDRLTEEFRPDGVIPFTISRAEAEQKFEQYLRKKHFVDRRFFSAEQREQISGVYYPYWITDVKGDASFDGEGRQINVVNTAKETITTTRIYEVKREGRVSLRGIIRQALSANDRKLSDGIHPYTLEDMAAFDTSYLSGFLAEKRDVEHAMIRDDVLKEAQGHADKLIKSSGRHYDRLTGTTNFHPEDVAARYCLLPTWVLTYRGDKPGTTFYFMMNGQTGKTCGRLPIRWSKLLGVAAVVGAVVAGALCLGGAMIW